MLTVVRTRRVDAEALELLLEFFVHVPGRCRVTILDPLTALLTRGDATHVDGISGIA